ncbi:hypothetical protein NL676_026260 [Syzygium grande]|nr:hypothetical protein NL676_026260 [Syzygium grande]
MFTIDKFKEDCHTVGFSHTSGPPKCLDLCYASTSLRRAPTKLDRWMGGTRTDIGPTNPCPSRPMARKISNLISRKGPGLNGPKRASLDGLLPEKEVTCPMPALTNASSLISWDKLAKPI